METQNPVLGYTSNGRFYPAIAGGDPSATSAAVMAALENSGATENNEGEETEPVESNQAGGNGNEPTQQQQGETQESPDSLAPDFLKGVPDEDKAVLEKYIKQWDGNVTRKFQSIHEQYAPYKELGEPETVQQAMQVAEMLQTEPETLFTALAEALGYDIDGGEGETPGGETQENQYQLPPEFQQEFGQMRTIVEQLAQAYLENQNQTQQSQEDEELDNLFEELHTQYGEFDENYVMSQMLNGVDPDNAVRNFNAMLQQHIQQNGQQNQQTSVPILSGGGTVPPNEKARKMGDLDSSDIKKAITNLLG